MVPSSCRTTHQLTPTILITTTTTATTATTATTTTTTMTTLVTRITTTQRDTTVTMPAATMAVVMPGVATAADPAVEATRDSQ